MWMSWPRAFLLTFPAKATRCRQAERRSSAIDTNTIPSMTCLPTVSRTVTRTKSFFTSHRPDKVPEKVQPWEVDWLSAGSPLAGLLPGRPNSQVKDRLLSRTNDPL